ncbi:Transcriptional regulator of nonfermentable carbon utilization, variant 2 [Basidiobolus ranarum]|uniref:Transcriptional regulator of nonfermentable carbon utilization, variant 2 n=1 Tax=Basidiobolus ranarum TaxID=34480 RepID=A0ABR2WZL8_9FUNG
MAQVASNSIYEITNSPVSTDSTGSSLNNQPPLNSPEVEPSTHNKRRKTSRACSHCQKAHLTCDDSRPCKRCIKRNLATTCQDGQRKKAKYLLDNNTEVASEVNFSSYNLPPTPGCGFGSKALNLEYSVLSNMLANPAENIIDSTWSSTLEQGSDNSLLSIGTLVQRSPNLMNVVPAVSAIYHNPTAPYNYIEGYHYLFRYIKERMSKEEIIRVCKAFTSFRPSFIALVKNLTEEDMIYMEKSFLRIVLEFEKLISFSGTPTVVWRRTGQLALAGKEFSLLTQWSKEDLFSKPTYIYEVLASSC